MKYEIIVKESDPIGKVQGSIELASLLREKWEGLMMQESFYIVAMNRATDVLEIKRLFQGGIISTVVDPKIVFSTLLLMPTCTTFAVAHNHPSGNLNPSEEDISITEKLKSGAKLLDFSFLDHIIITRKYHYSFAEHGQMD